jgi:hypothetical protein
MRIEGVGGTRDSRLGFNLTGNLFHNHFLGSKLYLSVHLEYQLIPPIYTRERKRKKIWWSLLLTIKIGHVSYPYL